MITRYLPVFNQVEPDNLLGLTAGLVVAQVPVGYTGPVDAHDDVPAVPESYAVPVKEVSGLKFVENGILCSFDANGKIKSFAAADKALFLHFTEELNTFLPDRKYFAVECAQDETFLRLVALVPGSEWTTNVAADDAAYAAAIGAGRIVCINAHAKLPDGREAKSYRCIA